MTEGSATPGTGPSAKQIPIQIFYLNEGEEGLEISQVYQTRTIQHFESSQHVWDSRHMGVVIRAWILVSLCGVEGLSV